MRILIKVVSVIAVIALGVYVLFHILPWFVGILAAVGVVFELYRLWIRSKSDDWVPPTA